MIIAILFGVYIVASVLVIIHLINAVEAVRRDAATERKDLAERVMALSKPEALTQVRVPEAPMGTINYVRDEERDEAAA